MAPASEPVTSISRAQRWRALSRGVAFAGVITLAFSLVVALTLGRTRDIDAARARLPHAPSVGAAIIDLIGLPFEIATSLSSPAGRADVELRVRERQAAAVVERARNAATWRAFQAQPTSGEAGARVAEVCPSADPPDPTRCIADAHRVLDAIGIERARWRDRAGVFGLCAACALVIAALLRGASRFARDG